MKTPHAILIGLSLIAAAILFKDMPIRSALASSHGEARDISCVEYDGTSYQHAICYLLTDKTLTELSPGRIKGLHIKRVWDRKSGKLIEEYD